MRFLRSLFLLTLLAWWTAAGAQEPPAALELTPVQRAWVQTHPELRVGVSREYPPYYFVPPRPARPHGFVVSMIDLWGERLGMAVDVRRFDNNDEAVRALLAGEIDMVPYALPQAGNALVTLPVFSADQVLVARRDLADVSVNGDFGQYRVAVVEGSPAAALLATRYPAARVRLFAGAEDALRAVASGSADLFIGYQQVAVYNIEKLFLANLVIRRNLGPGSVAIGPTVRRDAQALREVLGRAMDSVTAADRSALAARWLPTSRLSAPSGEMAALTPAEKEWVGRHGRIRVGFDAAFSPITRMGELSEAEGLAIDYLRLVARKTGLQVQSEVGGAFADIYAKGMSGELDMVVGMVRTPQRRDEFDFVGPFSRVPTAIVMRIDDPSLLSDVREFGVRRVALLRQHFLIPELTARYPGVQLLEFERQDQVLAALAEGAADVALGNLKVVNEQIEHHFGGVLRITGTVAGGDSELYFGVRRGQPQLKAILRKGLDAVSDAESSEIADRWLVVRVQQGIPLRKLLTWGLPILLAVLTVIGLLWYSRRKLAQARATEARGRVVAEEAATSRGRFLSYLSHELRGTLGTVANAAEMVKGQPDAESRGKLLDAMSESMNGLSQVFESTLAFEQSLTKPIELQPQPQSLSALWTRMVAPGQLAAHQKGIGFDSRCEAQSETVLVDGPRLQQVVSNLLHNAVKFTDKGRVSVRGRWAEGEAASDEREFEITVTDDGPGITPDEVSRIFEPYAQGEQGKRLRHGAGLGLSIARQIVAAMRGRIDVHSAPGQGASFTLRVPLAIKR